MRRLHEFILVASTLLLSWLGMMIVHEAGHVLAAVASGGTVTKVVLHPLEFSRTDIFPNPHPLLTTWAGPVVGVAVPLAAWAAASVLRLPGRFLLRFFAGFCLIANGAYIGIGSFSQVGDTHGLLLFGSSRWHLWLFGLVTVLGGLLLWNRLGPYFGIGQGRDRAHPLAGYVVLALLVAVLLAELMWGGE